MQRPKSDNASCARSRRPTDKAVLFTVQFMVPAVAAERLDDFTALHRLNLSTWHLPEHDVCDVRIYCETRTAAKRITTLVRHELSDLLILQDDKNSVSIQELAREDWAESWKRFFHTFHASPRLVVKPAWETYAPNAAEVVLEIDPGMSFGTGYHGTTRACLEFIDQLSREMPGVSLLDVGTGSGILAMAASRLGFQPVWACDHDPIAVSIARDNLIKAGCASVHVREADLETYSPPRRARVVVANILAPVLIRFAPRLAAFVGAHGKQPGYLILSGILTAQFNEVVAAFATHGCNLLELRTLDEWTSGLFSVTVKPAREPGKV